MHQKSTAKRLKKFVMAPAFDSVRPVKYGEAVSKVAGRILEIRPEIVTGFSKYEDSQ